MRLLRIRTLFASTALVAVALAGADASAAKAVTLKRYYQKGVSKLDSGPVLTTAEGSQHLDMQHYTSVRDGALAMLKQYPPANHYYVSLGRSLHPASAPAPSTRSPLRRHRHDRRSGAIDTAAAPAPSTRSPLWCPHGHGVQQDHRRGAARRVRLARRAVRRLLVDQSDGSGPHARRPDRRARPLGRRLARARRPSHVGRPPARARPARGVPV